MRRIDRAVTDDQQITSIIEQAKVVHIGMIDNDRPYVVPMQYGFVFCDGKLTLYVHCAKEGRKLDILKKNPCVFIELETNVAIVSGGDVPCKYGSEYASVMGEGTAVIVEDVAEKGILVVVLRRPHGVVASLAYIILHPAVQRQESRQQATNFIRERHT